jgi:hypothetical protein
MSKFPLAIHAIFNEIIEDRSLSPAPVPIHAPEFPSMNNPAGRCAGSIHTIFILLKAIGGPSILSKSNNLFSAKREESGSSGGPEARFSEFFSGMIRERASGRPID